MSALAGVLLSVTAWTSPCVERGAGAPLDCGLPRPVSHDALEYPLPLTELEPGDVKVHKYQQSLKHGTQDLTYELRLFEVYPKQGPRYYQAQLEWTSPARAMCMLSVDASKTQWSPLNCIAVDASGARWGLLVQTKMAPQVLPNSIHTGQ